MDIRKLGVFIIVFSCTSILMAQETVKIKKKEFKIPNQTEGFKKAWKNIHEGDKYFKQGIGTYNLARDHYLFAESYNGENAELNYKIGLCYLSSDNKFKAIDYILKAYELKPEVSEKIKLSIGRSYQQALEFEKAKQYYEEYKQEMPLTKDIVAQANILDKLVLECTNGIELLKSPQRVIINNLGEAVNSPYDDYNPKFTYMDTALFFTARRPVKKKSKRSEVDNKFFENIYISSISDNEFKQARPLGKLFNTSGNDAIVGVAPDGSSVFIYRGGEKGGDIEQAIYDQEKEKWKKPKSLSKSIGSDASETTAALAPNGNELYFVSSNPELTIGGKDIFVSKKNSKGKWEEPRNLGGLINSRYDEEGVYLTSDGESMYFASKGHNSMGGFDIFKCTKNKEGGWSSPENLGYPINTPEDDVFYISDKDGTYGYYSTTRPEGFGGKDIYKVVKLGTEKEFYTLTKEKLVAGLDYLEKKPFLNVPDLMSISNTLILSGKVRDTIGNSDTTVMASLVFMNTGSGEVIARAITDKQGAYKVQIDNPTTCGIEINAKGYLYFLDIIDLTGYNPDELANKDFYLQKIEVGTKVVLKNIYFETGKSVLTSESDDALNKVRRFLENNKSVRLEISGHTDNTGSSRVNSELSTNRAKAVVDYLIAQGISKSRLEYKGFADTQPVADNSTAEGREKNRRVEFKVLSK